MDKKLIESHVDHYMDELLFRLKETVAYPSVSEYDPNNNENPFGITCTQCLNHVLTYGEQDGFTSVNVDNYAGYIEMGMGEKTIGICGHLDVVPAGDGWNKDPYDMTIENGVVYGRGVADDKGAVIAALTAMKVIRDMEIPLTKKIRLIMGINEEKGSRCLTHYVQKYGSVDYGFTPDGDFPVIFGEKGMVGASFAGKSGSIKSIEGGTVSNAVCFKVKAVITDANLDIKALTQYFDDAPVSYTLSALDDGLTIEVIGKSAHASLPHLGINAIAYLMDGLYHSGCKDEFVLFYHDVFGMSTNGSTSGIYCRDQYGELTMNNGLISMDENGLIHGSIDIRVPVQCDPNEVADKLAKASCHGVTIDIVDTVHSLYYDPSSPFIQSLLKAYRDITGDTESEPMVIGGGTYAKEINNVVAFGCAFPHDYPYNLHDVNESVPVSELKAQVMIYVQAILNLLALEDH